MYKAEALSYFGTKTNLARAAGVRLASIYKWGDLVPEGRAVRLQIASQGALKYDPAIYEKHDKEKHTVLPNHRNQA
ncbi:transcriptional regulator [Cronobacter sakazakii]|nr:transcriptional regulator [Cronobacter sakazakii]ELY2690354.1 transcriptional regulator [Cronobacter sakazakii]ELY3415918.1 transcriptional regulator [Cronobacter sakazakii]ELY5945991.1 transcriptional regulator [Cronobacter sakazakii]